MVHNSSSASDVDDAVSGGEVDWDSCFAIALDFWVQPAERIKSMQLEQLECRMVVEYVVSKSVTLARNFGSAWWGLMPIPD